MIGRLHIALCERGGSFKHVEVDGCIQSRKTNSEAVFTITNLGGRIAVTGPDGRTQLLDNSRRAAEEILALIEDFD